MKSIRSYLRSCNQIIKFLCSQKKDNQQNNPLHCKWCAFHSTTFIYSCRPSLPFNIQNMCCVPRDTKHSCHDEIVPQWRRVSCSYISYPVHLLSVVQFKSGTLSMNARTSSKKYVSVAKKSKPSFLSLHFGQRHNGRHISRCQHVCYCTSNVFFFLWVDLWPWCHRSFTFHSGELKLFWTVPSEPDTSKTCLCATFSVLLS